MLKKPHLRDGDNTSPSILEHLYPVQLAQLVTVTLLLLFMLFILLSIRSTLSSLKHQVKRISRLVSVATSLPVSLHGTMDREKVWLLKRFQNMLENLSLHLPGCTSHGKWTGGERDVCRREGAGSSFCYVVHPWIRHNMRDFLDRPNNKEQCRESKFAPLLCRWFKGLLWFKKLTGQIKALQIVLWHQTIERKWGVQELTIWKTILWDQTIKSKDWAYVCSSIFHNMKNFPDTSKTLRIYK